MAFRESQDHRFLDSRIWMAGLMSEWKAFWTLVVTYLGMLTKEKNRSAI